jgi:hypothetical protein
MMAANQNPTTEAAMALPHIPRTAAGAPVACALGAADLSAQAERWRRLIAHAGIARLDAPNGLRIEFRADGAAAEELRGLVAIEKECCAWAQWSVGVAPGYLTLDVTSSGDGIAAIRHMLA